MDATICGPRVPGLRPTSPAARALELGVMIDLARMVRGCMHPASEALGIEPELEVRAIRLGQGEVPLPGEVNGAGFNAVAELAAQLFAGDLAPMRERLLQVVVRRLLVLRGPADGELGFDAHRRAATTPALERVRSLTAARGLSRAERRDALDAARDQLRPLVARAFQERDGELGRDLADQLPDDLLLAAAVLHEGQRRVIGESLSCSFEEGRSTKRLRARARRLIASARRSVAQRSAAEQKAEQEQAAEILSRRQQHARRESLLGVILALVWEAEGLAMAGGLPFQVRLVPRSLARLPAPVAGPGCCGAAGRPSVDTSDLAKRALAWLGRLWRGLAFVRARLPTSGHELLWPEPEPVARGP